MQKRGTIEIQFNWIFVLIAGALILAFFVMVANTYMKTSEFSAEVKLRSSLDSIINNAKHSPGTIFEITMKKADLSYEDCYQGISVGNRVSEIPVRTTFAPSLIQSTLGKVYLWAVGWDMPYKVDNFIFMTSPDVRYIIVKPLDVTKQKYALEIFNATRQVSLPARINRVLAKLDGGRLVDMNNNPRLAGNYYNIRLVFFDPPGTITLDNSFADLQISAVVIRPGTDGLDGYGGVDYCKRAGLSTMLTDCSIQTEPQTKYLGRASVFAAIFAENSTMYDCGMRQAVNRLRAVTTVYKARIGELRQNITGDCNPANLPELYDPTFSFLDAMLTNTNTFLTGNFDNIYWVAADLRNKNQMATMLSCPLIY